jgi:hypothetical protein
MGPKFDVLIREFLAPKMSACLYQYFLRDLGELGRLAKDEERFIFISEIVQHLPREIRDEAQKFRRRLYREEKVKILQNLSSEGLEALSQRVMDLIDKMSKQEYAALIDRIITQDYRKDKVKALFLCVLKREMGEEKLGIPQAMSEEVVESEESRAPEEVVSAEENIPPVEEVYPEEGYPGGEWPPGVGELEPRGRYEIGRLPFDK